MVKTKIVNVVATANLNQQVNLIKLAEINGITYNINRYGGRVAYLKTPRMQGKVSIFGSGKIISVGSKSKKRAFFELNFARDLLLRRKIIQFPVSIYPKVRNIVVTADFGSKIDLEALSFNKKMIYEPEQFPGGILRITDPFNLTILVFSSGKVVIPGLIDEKQIESVLNKMRDIIDSSNF